jgi:hypothetical protein
MDDAFRVANKHMPSLNSVEIFIDQGYFLSDDEVGGLGGGIGYGTGDKKLILSTEIVKEFLELNSSKLTSFSFRLDECCSEEMKEMSDGGSALVPLGSMSNLRKLDLSGFGFDNIEVIKSCLSIRLQSLRLDGLMMDERSEWSTAQVDSLVAKLSKLTNLVSLSIADDCIADHHLSTLLPRLQHLKCLDVSGGFGTVGTEGRPQLTDHGLASIATNCPRIQSLSLNYQRKLTFHGVMSLLRKCSDIVELELGDVNIGLDKIGEIVRTPPRLIYYLCGKIGFRPDVRKQMLIQRAVQTTGGRVVVCTVSGGLVKVNLSPGEKQMQEESIAKVERANEQYYGHSVSNKWHGII